MRGNWLLTLAATTVLVAFFAGCATPKKEKPKAAAAAPAAAPLHRVGTVAVVNERLRFVLLDVGTLYTPSAGSELKCFSGGTETGTVNVTAERKRPYVAADIVKGTPEVGDEVKE